jgi:hypothetical protein
VPEYPFPEVVDNTMVSAFRRCEKYWYYQSIRRIVPRAVSTHLVAGMAFARGLEVTRKSFFDSGLSFANSLDEGMRALIIAYGDHEPPEYLKTKSVWRMLNGLEFYFKEFPIDKILTPISTSKSGKSAIEYSFAEPTNVRHPISGDPILYAGRFDMFARHDSGSIYVVDEKTTTTLGQSWYDRWKMSNQMTGYIWATRNSPYKAQGAWVRGLAILSKGYSVANAPIHRPQWRIDAFERNLTLTLEKMKLAWEHSQYQLNYDSGCQSYSGCSYIELCDTQTPEDYIPINFFPNTWNPLEHKD